MKNSSEKKSIIKAIAIVVILAIVVWAVCVFRPVSLIPEGAENIRIDVTGYSDDTVKDGSAHIIVRRYEGSFEQSVTHLVTLTEEGQQKLIEVLKSQKIHAVLSSPSMQWREEGSLFFVMHFEKDGKDCSRVFYCNDDIQVVRSDIKKDSGSPVIAFGIGRDTIISGKDAADRLFSDILDIIGNYAASDITVK